MKKICDKCGGAGTLTPEPEIITVRIKGMGGATWYNIGDVFQVIECNDPQFYQVTNANGLFAKMICEVIPPIPEGYRLRRKWGKDEEKLSKNDLYRYPNMNEWRIVTHIMICCGQAEMAVYITPIKQPTPDPSADCLPDIQEAKYLIGSIKQALQAFPGDSVFDESAVGLRYGTIRDLLAIMLNDAEEMGRSWKAKKESE